MNIFTGFPLRLTIPVVLLLLALLTEGYIIRYNWKMIDDEEEKEGLAFVVQEMAELQDSAGYRLRNNDPEGVQSALVTRGANSHITLVVLTDDGGTIIASTSLKLIGRPIGQALPDADAAIMKEVAATLSGRALMSRDRKLITAYYPVILGVRGGDIRPRRIGILHMRYDLTTAKASRHHEVEHQVLVMIGVNAGCFLLLGLFLQLVFTGRVNRLVSTARRIAAGEFAAGSGIEGRDELAQIGEAIDRMSGEIARNHQALQSAAAEYRSAGSYNRSLIEASLDPLVTIDADGKITDVNSATEKVTGCGRTELIGADFSDYFADPDRARAGYQLAFREGSVRDYELEVRRRDGHLTPVLYNASVYHNDAGEVRGVFAAARDITELRRTGHALVEQSRQMDAFFRHSLTPIVFLDRDFNFIRVNSAYAKACQRDESEFAGRNHFELYPHEENEALFRQVVETKTPCQATAKPFIFPDHPEWGVTYWDWILTPIMDETGEIDFLVYSLNNVTEHERAWQRIREQAALIDLAHDAIIVRDVRNRITFWNRGAEELYGWRQEEATGLVTHELLKTSFPGSLGEIDAMLLAEGHWEGELLHTTRDGRAITVESRWVLERGGEGSPTALLEINRDITERKSAEVELRKLYEELEQRVGERTADLSRKSTELVESQTALMNIVDDLNQKTEELEQANARLKELDRLKSLFIASMSHELRTPLNSIIGFSSVLLNEWIGPVNEEQKVNLAIILRSGRHLLNLINDVIDVSKIEAGKIESFPEAFDLHGLIDEAISLVRKDMEEKGLDLRVDVPPREMFTDRRRLLQSVLNLLSNAVKFTEQGGVTVETRVIRERGAPGGGEVAEISVTDTGVGIRGDDLPKMFHPFVRLAQPGTVPGTGLGLYLTRKLAAEILKGDILLSSEYGKGSRFTLRIPVRLP